MASCSQAGTGSPPAALESVGVKDGCSGINWKPAPFQIRMDHSFLSANTGGLTKHVRNTPGWKHDRLAESAPTSFDETKKAAVRAYLFLSVKQSFDFHGVHESTFVVVLQLLASGVFLLFVVLLPFVEETSPPPVGF